MKIGLSEKIGYGLGDMSSSMFWKLFGAYLMIFYTDVFGISAAIVGTMFAVTRVWDSFFDPIVGAVADRTSSRWGRFRPYLLYLAVPFGLIGILTFLTPPFGETGKIVYAFITYGLMMMVYSAINVPYASLLGVMSPAPADRNTLATYRMTFAYLGSFVALLLFMPLVNAFGGADDNGPMHGWLTASQFGWLMAVASLVFNSIRDGATVYYFKYYVDETAIGSISFLGLPFVLSGLYLAVGQAANIVGVILAAPISNRIGKRRTFMAAMAVASVLSIIFFWLDKDQLLLIFVLQALISICAGSIFPLLWSMYADCADYSELQTGNRATGLIFSSSSMSQKFGWAFGTAITGWMLAQFGFQANAVQSAETIQGIKMFLSILPAIGALLSLAFIYFYPLSEQRMKQITHELEEKRADTASTKVQ